MGRGASGYNPHKHVGPVWCDNLGESRIASSELFLLMESLPHRKRTRGESVGGGRNEDGEHGDRGSTAMPCARSWWSCGRRPNGSAASVANRCCALWWKAWNGMAIGLARLGTDASCAAGHAAIPDVRDRVTGGCVGLSFIDQREIHAWHVGVPPPVHANLSFRPSTVSGEIFPPRRSKPVHDGYLRSAARCRSLWWSESG